MKKEKMLKKMSLLQQLMLMIMAILPSWILAMPFFKHLIKKQEKAQIKVVEDMFLGDSLFEMNDFIDDQPLPKGLRRDLMPKHVGVILDGNRRWAKKRGRTPVEGYQAGLAILGVFLSVCRAWKIPIVSLFLFSSENWGRPKVEVDYLLDLFERSLKYYILRYCQRFGGKVSIIGDTSTFPKSLQKAMKEIEEETKEYNEIHLICAMGYSGQNDIVQACQNIAMKVKDGVIHPKDITKFLFEQHLQTMVADVSSPDLLIRTSGEIRISNYYLWQSAYTEMYFTNTLWPDFDEDEFVKALRSFQQRGRRYGKI